MRNKILVVLITIVLSAINLNGQTNTTTFDPAGSWKYEAPYAPEGYNSGSIVVATVEKKLTVTISITGTDVKIAAEKVKFENNNLTFSVWVEGEEVQIAMKMETAVKMTGKAITSQGDIPLSAAKDTEAVKK